MTKEDVKRIKETIDRYPPNILTKFYFSYMGKDVSPQNRTQKKVFEYLMFILFIVMMVFVALDNRNVVSILVIVYSITLGLTVIGGFVAVFTNNHRISHICKELNISKSQYDYFVHKYNL
jgi:hypothetical protein